MKLQNGFLADEVTQGLQHLGPDSSGAEIGQGIKLATIGRVGETELEVAGRSPLIEPKALHLLDEL